MTGTIKNVVFNKGFGFIEDATGQEYFFHFSAVRDGRVEDLREGDRVEFDPVQGPKGPRAEHVRAMR